MDTQLHETKLKEVPRLFKDENRWVCANGDEKSPRTTTNKNADSTKKQTWTSFRDACQAVDKHPDLTDVGYVLGDNIIGFDFDNVYDPMTNSWNKDAKKIIDILTEARAYIEFSRSGTGCHAMLQFDCNDDTYKSLRHNFGSSKSGFRKGWIEYYEQDRYFIVTGKQLDNTDPSFNDTEKHKSGATKALKQLIGILDIKQRSSVPSHKTEVGMTHLSNSDVIAKASNATNGQKFIDLFNGNWKPYAKTQSEADQSLIKMLVFWTGGDPNRTQELFEQSKLYREKKGGDYIINSIRKSIEQTTDVYSDKKAKQKQPKKQKQEKVVVTSIDQLPQEQLDKIEKEAKPTIIVNEFDVSGYTDDRKVTHVARDVVKVLEQQDPNESKVFINSKVIGQIKSDVKRKKMVNGKPMEIKQSEFKAFTDSSLRGALDSFMTFYKVFGGNNPRVTRLDEAKKNVCTQIIENEKLDNIPFLSQIVNHPIVTEDWQIINKPGYHNDTGMYFDEAGQVDIIDMSVEEAYDIIADWLRDFPFKAYSDMCNTLSMLFTMLFRPALPEGELPPLFVITSPDPGSGKSTLAQVCSAIITGNPAGSTQISTNEEEIRKQIGAEIILGSAIIVLDNVKTGKTLKSGALASAISEPIIRFRMLGQSKMVHADNLATYILTGNNLDADDELVDRACFIRLDSDERAADRDFTNESILADTIKNRQRLFSAVYVIAKDYIGTKAETDNGKPLYGKAKHRSHVWAKIMSGLLDHLDKAVGYEIEEQTTNDKDEQETVTVRPLTQFLENDVEARQGANPAFMDMCNFRDEVMKLYGTKEWTASNVFEIASFDDEGSNSKNLNLLGEHIKEANKTEQRKKNFGIFMRSQIDRTFGKYKLLCIKKPRHNKFRFKPIKTEDDIK